MILDPLSSLALPLVHLFDVNGRGQRGNGDGMNSPGCREEGRSGAKFCQEWGARLVLSCAKCQGDLAPTAKFLPKHLAEKIPTSKSALEGDRKRVISVADLKGSMKARCRRTTAGNLLLRRSSAPASSVQATARAVSLPGLPRKQHARYHGGDESERGDSNAPG